MLKRFLTYLLKKKTAVGYIFKHQSNNGAEALKGETRVFSSFYPFNYKWSAKSLYMHIEHHVFFVVIKQFFFFSILLQDHKPVKAVCFIF